MTKQDMHIDSQAGRLTAYVSVPEQPNGVAVVVLQEIFGVNANIRTVADGFAAAGFTAIAPDLFWRQEPGIELDPASETDRECAMKLMGGLDRDQSVADATAALAALRARFPGLRHAAAVGYCYGGGVAYLLAVRGAVDAGISYYGTGLHTMLSELAALEGKVLMHIAAEDYICPPEAQRAIVEAADQAGDRARVLTHPDVGHAFARIGGSAFDQQAADRANAATMQLLASLTETA